MHHFHSSVNPFFMTTFIHSVIYLSIPYIHLSSILPFIYLSIHSSIHSSINLSLTLIHSSIFLFTIHVFHPYIYPFIYLYIHSFIYLTILLIYPSIHSLLCFLHRILKRHMLSVHKERQYWTSYGRSFVKKQNSTKKALKKKS